MKNPFSGITWVVIFVLVYIIIGQALSWLVIAMLKVTPGWATFIKLIALVGSFSLAIKLSVVEVGKNVIAPLYKQWGKTIDPETGLVELQLCDTGYNAYLPWWEVDLDGLVTTDQRTIVEVSGEFLTSNNVTVRVKVTFTFKILTSHVINYIRLGESQSARENMIKTRLQEYLQMHCSDTLRLFHDSDLERNKTVICASLAIPFGGDECTQIEVDLGQSFVSVAIGDPTRDENVQAAAEAATIIELNAQAIMAGMAAQGFVVDGRIDFTIPGAQETYNQFTRMVARNAATNPQVVEVYGLEGGGYLDASGILGGGGGGKKRKRN